MPPLPTPFHFPRFIYTSLTLLNVLNLTSARALPLTLALMAPALLSSPEDGLSVVFESHTCDGQNDDTPGAGAGKEGPRCRGFVNEKQGRSGE
jgi:hypothetical protein